MDNTLFDFSTFIDELKKLKEKDFFDKLIFFFKYYFKLQHSAFFICTGIIFIFIAFLGGIFNGQAHYHHIFIFFWISLVPAILSSGVLTGFRAQWLKNYKYIGIFLLTGIGYAASILYAHIDSQISRAPDLGVMLVYYLFGSVLSLIGIIFWSVVIVFIFFLIKRIIQRNSSNKTATE